MLSREVIPEPCLYEAAFYGDIRELEKALESGQDPKSQDFSGCTAFHIAAANGQTGVIQALLDRGYNIDEPNAHGCTALHLAARNGHMETIKLLVRRGGNVKLETAKGRSVLAVAMCHADRERQRAVIDFIRKCEREKMSWEID